MLNQSQNYEETGVWWSGWPEKDDHELLALIQDGSHDAFAVLVQRHTERFYRLAYRYVQNRETAEDIVQDAFLKLWEDPGRWQPERNSKFTTWFYRIVVNLCLDWQKKKRPLALDEELLLADERETSGYSDDTHSRTASTGARDCCPP